ncbi:MAG: TetR/AcrR family transcriptional regulator [Cyanobacteria bacterium P01_F01_bin.86]
MPKIVDHDRYRKDLLSKCLKLFAERGYGSITMRQIAQGLGVSTGTLYHYFPSKEGIFIQLVQELCEQDIAIFFTQAPQGETARDRLRIVMEFFLENFKFYQQQLLLWIDFYQHSQRQPVDDPRFLQGLWHRTHDQLAAYLQLPNPAHVSFVLVFIDGLLLQCLYDHDQAEQDWVAQQVELLIELLDLT